MVYNYLMVVSSDRKRVRKVSELELSLYAEEPVNDGQVVKIGTSENLIVPCGDNEIPIGICQKYVSQTTIDYVDVGMLGPTDILCPVTIIGIVPVRSGAAIPMNAWVRSGPNGTVIEFTGDGSDEIIGVNLDEVSAANESTHIQVHRIPATGEVEVDNLLLESGDNLLLENGDLLLLE